MIAQDAPHPGPEPALPPFDTEDDLLHWVAFASMPGIGPIKGRALIASLGSPTAILTARPGSLKRLTRMGKMLMDEWPARIEAHLTLAARILARCQELGVEVITCQSSAYPAMLAQIPDGPLLLYRRGPADLHAPRMVAVVGTRQATRYGKQITRDLIEAMAPYGPTIVSGLAQGIDTVAHQAALDLGLPTVAVFATAPDRCYPAANRELARRIASQGAILTEYPPFSKGDAMNFPARNRIVAGLCSATLIVEAGLGGGALITAALALDYNREVLAVPGPITEPTSAGCHRLIARGEAALIEGPEHVIEQLGWATASSASASEADTPAGLFDRENGSPAPKSIKKIRVNSAPTSNGRAERIAKLEGPALKLAERLVTEGGPMHVDELTFACGMTANQVASVLLELEFGGVIRALPGKKFGLI